uniref:Helitron helicase-like domain-containing protein n=1 Tax=Octopus bimaculoides TaxID=37653 RepID=A0A0L8G0H6_OCTBM
MIRLLLRILDVLSFSHTLVGPSTCMKKCRMLLLMSTTVAVHIFSSPSLVIQNGLTSSLTYFMAKNPPDRNNITLRVFHLKLMKMMDIIKHRYIFGSLRCFMYTIEWQKRGLPHVHILLWLQNKLMSTLCYQCRTAKSSRRPSPFLKS